MRCSSINVTKRVLQFSTRMRALSEESANADIQQAVECASSRGIRLNWVFQGPPGVGKGTYATRAADAMGIPHVATGDLIRHEIAQQSTIGQEIAPIVQRGQLIDDKQACRLVEQRLQRGFEAGESGVLLDGYPRTVAQAQRLLNTTKLVGVLNMRLREDVLVEKCTGRRKCRHCGANYNIADIQKPEGANGEPAVTMPPLPPEPECEDHLEKRSDDTEEVVRERLRVYHQESAPIEQFFKAHGLQHEFEITAGIPHTLPRLLHTLADILNTSK